MAKYAGYNNWQGLSEYNQQLDKIPNITKNNNRLVIGGVFIIILLIFIVFIYLKYNSNTVKIVGPVSFTYSQNNDSAVPNIIVFDYNVENIVADSFFIVESTNDYRKKRLNVKAGQMTSAYFNPGNYEAFLIAH